MSRISWRRMSVILVTALAAAGSAEAQQAPMGPYIGIDGPNLRKGISLRYGRKGKQELVVYRARSNVPAPVVLIFGHSGWETTVNGYGTLAMVDDLNRRGVAGVYLSTDGDSIAEDWEQVSQALKMLASRSEANRLDLSRIVVVGEGSSAHFAALLATDPAVAASTPLAFGALRATVLLDGEGFDLKSFIANSPRSDVAAYLRPGAADAERRSPMTHVAAPNAPRFYFINYRNAPAGRLEEVNSFADGVKAAGAEVVLRTSWRADGQVGTKRFGWTGNPLSEELRDYLIASLK